MSSQSTLTHRSAGEQRKRAQSEPRTSSGRNLPQQQTTSGILGTAGKMLSNVNETMKECLPASIASYLPAGPDPKPVRQHKGPTGGVGSLPGTPNEEGVAKLPLEREQEVLQALRARKHKGSTGGVGSLPGTPNEEGVVTLPMERAKEVSEARRGRKHKGPTGGVGSLPGTPNEEGVMRLPMERAQEKLEKLLEDKSKAGQMDGTQRQDEDLGMAASGQDQDKGFSSGHPQLAEPANPTALSASLYGTPYTPQGDNLSTTAQKGSESGSSDGHSTPPASRDVTGEVPTVQWASGQAGVTGVAHRGATQKVKLMDKVKGEAKVIHGKITKNEEDIKEGQRMKGKI